MADGAGMNCPSRKALFKTSCSVSFLFCALLFHSGPIYGQEERGPVLPQGEGRELVATTCSQCHALKEIEILRDGQKGWQDTVDRMVLYGAQLTPSEAEIVTHYLATQLGPGTSPMPSGAIPPHSALGEGVKKISLPEGPGKALVAAGCVQCHDLVRVVSTARSKADWESITNDMVQRGMNATPAETRTMISYLQANFSTPQTGSTPVHTAAAPAHAAEAEIASVPAASAPAQAREPVRAGEEIFSQRCSSCHSIVKNEARVGPSLHAEMRKKTEPEIRTIINDGKGKMPPFKEILSKQDVDDLLAYLRTV